MIKNDTNKMKFNMENFDNTINSCILMALFGAETPDISPDTNNGSIFVTGDTINVFKDTQIGSRFYIFVKNAKYTKENLDIANDLLLSALDFLKFENILANIESTPSMKEENFVFNINLSFIDKTENKNLEYNTAKKTYNLLNI